MTKSGNVQEDTQPLVPAVVQEMAERLKRKTESMRMKWIRMLRLEDSK